MSKSISVIIPENKIKTVTSKDGLNNAIESNIPRIIIQGHLAQKIYKNYRARKNFRKIGIPIMGILTVISAGTFAFVDAAVLAGGVIISEALTKKLDRYYCKFVSEEEIILTMKDEVIKKYL